MGGGMYCPGRSKDQEMFLEGETWGRGGGAPTAQGVIPWDLSDTQP